MSGEGPQRMFVLLVLAGVAAATVPAGGLVPLRHRGDAVGVPGGVVPADVVVGVGVERRLVPAGLPLLEQLPQVGLHQRPVDVVFLLAVRAVDDDALDAGRLEQRAEDLQFGEVVEYAGALLHGQRRRTRSVGGPELGPGCVVPATHGPHGSARTGERLPPHTAAYDQGRSLPHARPGAASHTGPEPEGWPPTMQPDDSVPEGLATELPAKFAPLGLTYDDVLLIP